MGDWKRVLWRVLATALTWIGTVAGVAFTASRVIVHSADAGDKMATVVDGVGKLQRYGTVDVGTLLLLLVGILGAAIVTAFVWKRGPFRALKTPESPARSDARGQPGAPAEQWPRPLDAAELERWARFERIELWKMVVLSLGFDPEGFPASKLEEGEFAMRLREAEASLPDGFGTNGATELVETDGRRIKSRVKPFHFVLWALRRSVTVPVQFRRIVLKNDEPWPAPEPTPPQSADPSGLPPRVLEALQVSGGANSGPSQAAAASAPSSREQPVDVIATMGTIPARAIGSVRAPEITPLGDSKFDCQLLVDFFGLSPPFRPSPERLVLRDPSREVAIATLQVQRPTTNPDVVFYRAQGDWSDLLKVANGIFELGDKGKLLLLEVAIALPEGPAHGESQVKLDFELANYGNVSMKRMWVPVFIFNRPDNKAILAITPNAPPPKINMVPSGGTRS